MSLNNLSELSRVNEELKREIAERKRTENELEQRTQLLATLLDVSNLVTSAMEIKPLLEAILDRLQLIIDYEGARIFIIEGEYLKILAHRSLLSEKEESNYSFVYKNLPVTKEIIMDKKPIVISDVQHDSTIGEAFTEVVGKNIESIFGYIRSWIGIPLIVKNKVIGALTIDHSEPGYYLPKHAEIGMAFANQAAIEYENARLYNETLQRADEMQTMFAVQQAITSRLELNAVMKLIADEARRLTSSERTAVFMVEGNDLVLSVFSGKASPDFLGYRLPIHATFAGQLLLSGKATIVNNAQDDPMVYPGLIMKAGVKSFLSVPLMVGSKSIGMIAAADKLTGNYHDEDERILTMLASSAVIGIENARMYGEERRRHLEDQQRRRVAEGLRDILAILNSNRPLQEILQYIVDQAVRLMNTKTGALYRCQDEQDILKIEAACGLPQEYVAEMSIPIGEGVVGQAVKERKPIFVSDVRKVMPKEFLDDPNRKSSLIWLINHYCGLLAIPLLCKNEVYGGIVLYYPQKEELSDEELELAMTFADQVTLAIDNARLREKAEEAAVAAERSRLARDLHDAVTQTLFSASIIAEVLPKIWDRNPQEGKKRLEELRQLARGALAEMRTLLLELRPATLDEATLKELLKHLTEATTGRARIPVALDVEGEIVLPIDVKIAFYRIAQEALNNVAKHSGASQVVVTLRENRCTLQNNCEIELIITDDGYGFEPGKISGDHLGIKIMQERAEAIGAKLSVESMKNKGTSICLCWKTRDGGNNNE